MHFIPISLPASSRRLQLTIESSSKLFHAVVIVGGAKGRLVTHNPIRLNSAAERRHVVVIVTTGGLAQQFYKLKLQAQ